MEQNNAGMNGMALLAFAGGALLGAGLAILFAPQSGRSTRRQIGGLADDVEEGANDLVHEAAQGLRDAKAKTSEWMGKARDFAKDKKAEIASEIGLSRS